VTAQSHPATVLTVHDGDTISVSIRLARTRARNADLGFHVYAENGWLVLHADIRLLGCNAIELKDPGGAEAQQNLAALLPLGTVVNVRTVSNDPDKWGGRWDGDVTLPDGTSLVDGLIRDGWAAPWTGLGPKPTPDWPRKAAA
jgi:endonuclease YncB( thermonuclease family)